MNGRLFTNIKSYRNLFFQTNSFRLFAMVSLLMLLTLHTSLVMGVMRPGSDERYPGNKALNGKTILERKAEVMSLAHQLPLGAIPPVSSILKNQSTQPMTRETTLIYLDRLADVIAAQFPVQTTLLLRKIYFDGAFVKTAEAIGSGFNQSNSMISVRYYNHNDYDILISSGLAQTEIVRKVYLLSAILQIGQTERAIELNGDATFYNLNPIISFVAAMSSHQLLSEILNTIPMKLLVTELSSKGLLDHPSNLINEVNGLTYLDQKYFDIAIQFSMPLKDVIDWNRQIDLYRYNQLLGLPDEETIKNRIFEPLARELELEGEENWFRLARQATKSGDLIKKSILVGLMASPKNSCQVIFNK